MTGEEKSEDITKQLDEQITMKEQTRVFANAFKTIAREAKNTEVLPRLVDETRGSMKMVLPITAGIAPGVHHIGTIAHMPVAGDQHQ